MTPKPNEKAKLVKENQQGIDPRVDEILLNPEGLLKKAYNRVEELNSNSLKKSYIESSLLCEPDMEKIAFILELPVEDITMYAEFFYNVTGWDRLTKIEHIQDLTHTRSSQRSKDEAVLKMWALTHGITFIAWRLGKKVNISPIDGLEDLFSTCIYKSKEAMFSNASSDAAKESTKWTKLSTDIARLLKIWTLDTAAAKRDLEIAIKEVIPEFGGLADALDAEGLAQLKEINSNYGSIEDETNEGGD